MVQRTHFHSVIMTLAATTAVAVFAAGCSQRGTVSNSSPRLTSVPAQVAPGGTNFVFDLGKYVTDREAGLLTYTVTSGGGYFDGSYYNRMFDAMGDYTIGYSVSDGAKVTNGTFDVRVKKSNFVVVKEDNNGLLLLDSSTNGVVHVTASSAPPALAAGLADGRLVYQLNSTQLWIFDPMTRTSVRLGTDSNGSTTFRAKTSNSRIFYTTGTAPNMTLFYYNPISGYSREISAAGLSSFDVMVNNADLAFYETGVNGQADIYYYDPSDDTSYPVGTEATDEQLLAVLPDGGVVFSRRGTSGETDLFYFKVGTGRVEIGSDVTALATRSKGYNAFGSNSEIVFTATNTGNREIFAWSPSTGQTATVIAGTDNVYDGIGDGNEVVYHTVVSTTEHDIFCYDIDTAVTSTVRNSTDIGTVFAVSKGSPAFAIVQGSSLTTSMHAVSLIATPVTATQAGGPFASTVGQLTNGDVVIQRSDGIAINHFDVSTGLWGTPIGGTGLSFEGDGLDDGDYVYTVTAGSQVDLSMWDSSASAVVVVSNTAGTDDYQARTQDGTILFSRIVAPNTTADLFSWNGTLETRLTTTDSAGLPHDHAVLGKYVGNR